jgi:hypothetical protein
MSQDDSSGRIKKSILMRYPVSFLEEVSRALIGYKSHRDNKQYYRAMPIFDTLVDYVTLDPDTRKRVYDMTKEELQKSKHHFIELPRSLVEDFRRLYHGPRTDGHLPLRYLSPGKAVDPAKGIVTIRKPVNFIEAWGSYDPEYIIFHGGFYYKETRHTQTPYGIFPTEVLVPMIDFSDPHLIYHETDTVPFSYWVALYDKGWTEASPVCTLIEKIIAESLEGAGYSPDSSEQKASSGGILSSIRDRLQL